MTFLSKIAMKTFYATRCRDFKVVLLRFPPLNMLLWCTVSINVCIIFGRTATGKNNSRVLTRRGHEADEVKNHLFRVTDEFLQHPKVIRPRPPLMAVQFPLALTGWRLIFRRRLPDQRNFNFDHFT